MADPVDLSTFKPESPEDFLKGVLGQLVGILKTKFDRFKNEMTGYLTDLGRSVLATTKLVVEGVYDQRDADLALHSQELFLNNILLRAEFLAYELAQSVLETVFKVVTSVVKNFTGLTFKL